MDNIITKFSEYWHHLKSIASPTHTFYRGQTDEKWPLKPGVFRGAFPENEKNVYDEAMVECSDELEGYFSHIEILSKMQHYGAPTRLLDITSDPLMALYFACELPEGYKDDKFCPNCKGEWIPPDSAVYIFRSAEEFVKRYDSDTVEILASLPKFSQKDQIEIRKRAKAERRVVLTSPKSKGLISAEQPDVITRLYHEIKKFRPAFDELINPEHLLSNFIVLPRKNHSRIIQQSGAFIIFGLGEDEICDSYKRPKELSYAEKIIIAGDSRQKILDELALLNITRKKVYPELNQFSFGRYLKDKYQGGFEK